MTASTRMYQAVDGKVPDRVPVVPKIWVGLGARLTGTDLVEVVRSPQVALRVIADAGRLCGVDAVRLFHFPPRNVQVRDDHVYEVDNSGNIIGEVDMKGGLQTLLTDASVYDVTNPYFMAHHHYWSAERSI